MNGLEELRQWMAHWLNGQGIPAVPVWESGKRTKLSGAVAAVSIRSCTGGPAGFQDYLGQRYEEESGLWQELYGRRAEVTLGLDIRAPRGGGEAACARLFSAMVQAFAAGGPEGIRLREISCGETVFDEEEGLFRCPVRAVGEVFLCAVTDESGSFTDFTVKGTRR